MAKLSFLLEAAEGLRLLLFHLSVSGTIWFCASVSRCFCSTPPHVSLTLSNDLLIKFQWLFYSHLTVHQWTQLGADTCSFSKHSLPLASRPPHSSGFPLLFPVCGSLFLHLSLNCLLHLGFCLWFSLNFGVLCSCFVFLLHAVCLQQINPFKMANLDELI